MAIKHDYLRVVGGGTFKVGGGEPMPPSKRLDAMRPTSWDEMQRAEQAVREGGGAGPMFSEHETFADYHFGTDIPTGREIQSGDDMAPAAEARGARTFVVGLIVALAVVLLLALGIGLASA